MTDAERAQLARLIDRYRVGIDDPDERCDARNDLRRAVESSGTVIYAGFVYTARYGELVTINMSRVVDLGEAECES